MKQAVIDYLKIHHDALRAYWQDKGPFPQGTTIEAHCDMVYSMHMLGEDHLIGQGAITGFVEILKQFDLPGWQPRTEGKSLSVHNCAYAFGVLNLLPVPKADLYQAVLAGRTPALDRIIDPISHHPKFPKSWAHHNWRISHWIGGIPSILLSLSKSGSAHATEFSALADPVREATNDLIDKRTGLIRAYKSDLLQKLFRIAYAVRHDPELGDVGGVAHILWFDHAVGRRYTALDALLAQSQMLFHRHAPFMEKIPYCLDFDIVQIVRTALEQTGGDRERDSERAKLMMADIASFFQTKPTETYKLHKLPGALATYHECALISGADTTATVSTEPVDIIKKAYWL